MRLFNILLATLFVFAVISCGDDTNKTPVDNDTVGTDDTIIDDTIADDTVTDTVVIDDTVTDQTVEPDDAEPVTDDATIIPDEMSDDLLTDEDTELPDEEMVDPLKAQFVGTWAEKLVLESITNTTLIKNIKSTTTRYKLGKISIENGELKIDQKICRILNETDQGNTIFPQKYCDILWYWRPGELSDPKPDISVTDNGGTISFVENRSWELRGMQKMTNPETDLMPTTNGDSRIFDHDEDGHPAFTLKFDGGVLSGDLYLVQRLSHELTGTLVSEGRIEGGVNWTDDQYTVDATNATLKLPKTSVIKNDISTFVYVKVDDNFTCEQVIDDLFN